MLTAQVVVEVHAVLARKTERKTCCFLGELQIDTCAHDYDFPRRASATTVSTWLLSGNISNVSMLATT